MILITWGTTMHSKGMAQTRMTKAKEKARVRSGMRQAWMTSGTAKYAGIIKSAQAPIPIMMMKE